MRRGPGRDSDLVIPNPFKSLCICAVGPPTPGSKHGPRGITPQLFASLLTLDTIDEGSTGFGISEYGVVLLMVRYDEVEDKSLEYLRFYPWAQMRSVGLLEPQAEPS